VERDGDHALSGHVVICNCNEKVRQIVEQLCGVADPPLDVVLLVQDMALWRANKEWHPRLERCRGRFLELEGCPATDAALRRASVATARSAVILADPRQREMADARSALVAIAIEHENPQVHTVMELFSSLSRTHVTGTEVNEIICQGELSEKLIAQSCITPGVKNVFDTLLTASADANKVLTVEVGAAAAGQSYRQLVRRAIAGDAPFMIFGFIVDAPGEPLLVVNPRAGSDPGKDTLLRATDRLLLLGRERPDLARFVGG